MCIAIPSKIISIDENGMAEIDINGVQTRASLILIDEPRVGDYVMVHAGFAINKIDVTAALESLAILQEFQ